VLEQNLFPPYQESAVKFRLSVTMLEDRSNPSTMDGLSDPTAPPSQPYDPGAPPPAQQPVAPTTGPSTSQPAYPYG
jgi:hypothetical protein